MQSSRKHSFYQFLPPASSAASDNHIRVSACRQVFTLYTLASRQLSKQSHYDFGLRGLIGLLRYAGIKKRMFPDMGDEEVR